MSDKAPAEGTRWEHDVKRRLIARDPAALTELYDQFGSYVYGTVPTLISAIPTDFGSIVL